ncbi:MAG: FkbM family methyltransferase [Flavobacteriales bacterium]|nr:FkbM family methyltransferase [Flavobacteriales bacterium]
MRIAKAFGHLVEHILRLGPLLGLRVLWLKQRGPGHRATIRHRDLAGPVTVRTGSSDLAIFDEVVMGGGYAFPLSTSPSVILDIGANIGLATLWFKRRYPNARIIAVEPDAENFELLQLNTKGLSGVELVHAAIAPTDGRIGFQREGLNPSAYHIRSLQGDEEGVVALSMTTLLSRFDLQRVDLLKLDIEGAEKELFEAADLGWMDRVHTFAVELHDRMRPGCGHAFFSASSRAKRNYDVHVYLVIATRA